MSTVTNRYLCIRDMVQHTLLTSVELNLHFALDYLIRWDYISIRAGRGNRVMKLATSPPYIRKVET